MIKSILFSLLLLFVVTDSTAQHCSNDCINGSALCCVQYNRVDTIVYVRDTLPAEPAPNLIAFPFLEVGVHNSPVMLLGVIWSTDQVIKNWNLYANTAFIGPRSKEFFSEFSIGNRFMVNLGISKGINVF